MSKKYRATDEAGTELLTDGDRVFLYDGKEYFLGACMGRYELESDSFSLGNCSVGRYDTCFADGRELPPEPGSTMGPEDYGYPLRTLTPIGKEAEDAVESILEAPGPEESSWTKESVETALRAILL